MGQEIERKFLVEGPYKCLATGKTHIVQGYLSRNACCTVRVRIRDDKGFLTIKGPSSADGLERYEFEKEISLGEAESLLKLALPGTVDKHRWLVPFENHVFEVDEFHGANEGLVMAEVELQSTAETFQKPPFLAEEVTGDARYYNSWLSQHPFAEWD